MTLILVLALVLGWSAAAPAQAPFFQGKTITIAVGTKAKWDEMEALAKDVMTTPPDVVARMRKLLGD